MALKKKFNRREFIGSAAMAGLGMTVVPRHVLGGPGFVPPSDKLNLLYVGCGTQGLREMCGLITNPKLQIVSVSDPVKLSTNYVDWSPNGIRNGIRRVLEDETWGEKFTGIPGGRDVGKDFVERYYAKTMGKSKYKGCMAYADFREQFEKENFDAVKVMTPDHHHATISIAAMKKGKHVVIHKPIGNRMYEARLAIETARKTGKRTHLLAWSHRPGTELVKKWIADGAIGTLKEIHNWSNRPVWPQWTSNPTETPPVPEGFDWQLWLGPVPDRPFHPNYTFNVFRGWYDFGAGSIADMGNYSMWPLFMTLGIETPPLSAEAYGTTTCQITDHVSRGVVNDVAFPYSCMVRFKFPAQKSLPPFDLIWYDGGMKPPVPDEVLADGGDLEREGMMFVGDKGRIVAGFRCEDPQLVPKARMTAFMQGKTQPAEEEERGNRDDVWIDSFLQDKESPGSFLLAGPVTETILLAGVALRARKRVDWDTSNMKVTNDQDANKFLRREYRQGWEL